MPRVTMELVLEHEEEGRSGGDVAAEFFYLLKQKFPSPEWCFVDYSVLGTTLTQDELDIIRFKGESGQDD